MSSYTVGRFQTYNLQFRYIDNDQIYNDTLILTNVEVVELELALNVLTRAGEITSPDGEASTDSMLVLYTAPQFNSLSALKYNWDANLNAKLAKAGFAWTELSQS